MELVSSLGIDSRSYAEQIKEKWKEDEREEDDDEEEMEEENMEQVESEEEAEDIRNHVNGDAAWMRAHKIQVPIHLHL